MGQRARTLRELGLPTLVALDDMRARMRNLKPCPLCKSDQLQFCGDANNPVKDVCKCRKCKCQAPRSAWQGRD